VSVVALKLSVSPRFVRREIAAGRLPAKRLPGRGRTQLRVKLEDVLAYLKALDQARAEERAPRAATLAFRRAGA
jgi:excisionase family DNA binding protein